MRISATGTSKSSPARAAGFTLIEILVVMLIIGILTAGAVLSVGVVGKDSGLDKERDRITALLDYLRDQAALQNREYGMRCFIGGYEFMVFDARTATWLRLQDDTMTRTRRLPPGLEMQVSIEGRAIVLPRVDETTQPPTPQIMLYSSGDLNLFELTLRRDVNGEAVRFAPAKDSDRIEVAALPAAPA
jgi:general secretion pathway protein H